MPVRTKKKIYLPTKDRIKDGRIFEINKRIKGVTYLRCQTKHCRGTAKKRRNGEIVLSRGHSSICFPDDLCQQKAEFKYDLKSALQRNYWRLKQLYDTTALLYPREIKIEIPYNSIKSAMKKWRKNSFPPNPTSLEEMAMQLEQPERARLLEYDVGRLVCRRITDSLGKVHVLLYDTHFVETVFRSVTRLFVDGTFRTTPNVTDVYQLLSILGVTYGHALPFAHILMSSKTEAAYTAVLTEIAQLIDSANVSIVMTDFEQALRNASKTVFTNAHITGCSVHYDRALLKKINKLKLNGLVNGDDVAKKFLKKLMALAFLPEELILPEYETLKNGLPEALATTFRGFLTYFERQWLRIVKPAGFCVFGLSKRTNNVIESYNSILADELGTHPSAWMFLVKLLKLASKARNDVESLRRNKRIKRHPRYSTVYKQRELLQAWKDLRAGDLTGAEFLDKAASLKGHVRKRLEIIANNPPEDEFEMTESPQTMRTDGDLDFDNEILESVSFVDEPVAVANDESDSHSPDPSSAVNQESDSENSVSDGMSVSSDGQELHPVDPPVELENEDDDVPPMDAVRDVAASSQASERHLIDPINDAEQLNVPNNDYHSDNESDRDDAVPDRMSVSSDGQESNSDYRPVEQEHEDGNVPPIDVVRGVEAGDEVLDRDDVHLMDLLDDADQMNGPNYGNHFDNDDIQEVARDIEIDVRGPVLGNWIVIDTTDSDSDEVQEVERDDGGINNDHPRAEIVLDASNDGAIAAAATAPASRPGVSRSRKKNLRKKRRRQMKALAGDLPPRPYGHKRRRRRNKAKKAQVPTCVVCLMNKVTHIFIPCGHNCCCERCATTIEQGNDKRCPKCRGDVQQVVRVFVEP